METSGDFHTASLHFVLLPFQSGIVTKGRIAGINVPRKPHPWPRGSYNLWDSDDGFSHLRTTPSTECAFVAIIEVACRTSNGQFKQPPRVILTLGVKDDSTK